MRQKHLITYDPSTSVKLVGQEDVSPQHLDDQEEQALVAAVTKKGTHEVCFSKSLVNAISIARFR